MNFDVERFDRFIIASVVFHVALFGIMLLSPSFQIGRDSNWGSSSGGLGGVNVKIVGNISGVPLPAPPVVNENAVANESAGFYKSQPATPAPPEDAEPIPAMKAPVKTSPPAKAARPEATKARNPDPPAPANAVPFGQGGRPALAYGQFATGAGQAGIGFGDGAFGDQYGWYVDAITRRISQNWLKSMVDERIRTAPRVYLEFEIQRNGAISEATVRQSSGIPSLDRSALRAIYASNPLPALPPDYRGTRVTVSFYFEYTK